MVFGLKRKKALRCARLQLSVGHPCHLMRELATPLNLKSILTFLRRPNHNSSSYSTFPKRSSFQKVIITM